MKQANVLWNFLFYTDHLLLGQKVMIEIIRQQKCRHIYVSRGKPAGK